MLIAIAVRLGNIRSLSLPCVLKFYLVKFTKMWFVTFVAVNENCTEGPVP